MGLTRDEIGVRLDPESCLHCLYCWFACPREALRVIGEPNHLAAQVARYRKVISDL